MNEYTPTEEQQALINEMSEFVDTYDMRVNKYPKTLYLSRAKFDVYSQYLKNTGRPYLYYFMEIPVRPSSIQSISAFTEKEKNHYVERAQQYIKENFALVDDFIYFFGHHYEDSTVLDFVLSEGWITNKQWTEVGKQALNIKTLTYQSE